MAIQVERGIPITGHAGRIPKYPWADMQVGDSFLSDVKASVNITTLRQRAEQKTGFKYACRTTPEGVRVWRIA